MTVESVFDVVGVEKSGNGRLCIRLAAENPDDLTDVRAVNYALEQARQRPGFANAAFNNASGVYPEALANLPPDTPPSKVIEAAKTAQARYVRDFYVLNAP